MAWGNPRTRTWATLVAAVAVCLTVGWSAWVLASYSWSQIVGYSSPYVSASVPYELTSAGATPGPPIAQRVVLVIVDGLRDDVSRSSMPTLKTMRDQGSDVSLVAPQPSLSFPNWTTILTGASPAVSGVTTNWCIGREPAPTLVDSVLQSGRAVVVAAPAEFTGLFGIKSGRGVVEEARPGEIDYLPGASVNDAISRSKETSAALVVVHLEELDVVGHELGGGSAAYREAAAQVDADISRLALGMQGAGTVFVVTADHGHTDSGGHGGWEPSVVRVPGVLSGQGVAHWRGSGDLAQLAPTVALLLGVKTPPYAQSQALRSVVATRDPSVFRSDAAHHVAFDTHYVGVVRGVWADEHELASGAGPDSVVVAAGNARLAAERRGRLPLAIALAVAGLCAVGMVAVASWRAGVAALAGTAAYYLVYEFLFFAAHGYRWSLSAFNTETYVKSFMNGRFVEAAAAALVAAAVAAYAYPWLRREPKGPQVAKYLPGHLVLGPATALVVLATLAFQVAWYLWKWGASVVWTLPDLQAAFKYDLDLVQMTAVGCAALLAPVVTYLIGRYHPKVQVYAE